MNQPPPQDNQQGVPPPPSPQLAPKPSDAMSTSAKVVLITTLGTVLVAIITSVLAPIVVSKFGSTPTPTATASLTTTSTSSGTTSNVYPPSGWKRAFDDPLKSNSSGYWPEGKEKDGGCEFINGAYRVSRWTPNGSYFCWPTGQDFNNFAFEVQMIITEGDEGAIFFRADTQSLSYYSFWISSDGTYGFEIWQNNSLSKTLVTSSHTAIHTGLYQPNTVAVVAQGNTFHLYVNDQLIDMATDKGSSYGHGNICLEAYSNSKPTEVLFSNVKIWTPSS